MFEWAKPMGGSAGTKYLSALMGRGERVEFGLARHEHVFDAAGAAATVRGQAGPGDVRGAGRLLAAADRDDLGVARGSRGVEELCRVALDDTSPEGGQVELVDHEPGLLDGVGAGPMIPTVTVAKCPTTRTQFRSRSGPP